MEEWRKRSVLFGHVLLCLVVVTLTLKRKIMKGAIKVISRHKEIEHFIVEKLKEG